MLLFFLLVSSALSDKLFEPISKPTCVIGDAAVGDGVNQDFIRFAVHTLQTGFHVNYDLIVICNRIAQLGEYAELSDDQKAVIGCLADMWDLPEVTAENSKWLFYRLLQHAVLGRTIRQIKQLRCGSTHVPPRGRRCVQP